MNCTMMFCSHVRFINSYTIKCMWDNLQLSGVGVDCVDGRRVFQCSTKLFHTGHASATLAHATAHKARYLMLQNKLKFIPLH